jgi:hypothetical protein
VKLSQASYRIAEGAVEPGRNIDIDEAASGAQKTDRGSVCRTHKELSAPCHKHLDL